MSNIADKFEKNQSLINYRCGTNDQLVLSLLHCLIDSGREIFGEIDRDDPAVRLETFIEKKSKIFP